MDELTRFARRLIEQLAGSSEGASRPVLVSQVRDKLLPYRTHRKALQLESVEDYETVLLRLVAGERGFVRTSPASSARMCQDELAGANPDLSVLDEVADATIQFTSLAAAQILGDEQDGSAAAPPPPAPEQPPAPPAPKVTVSVSPPPVLEARPSPRDDKPMTKPAPASHPKGSGCPACSREIPAGRQVVFCPWCGERLVPFTCHRCHTELDSAWQHCITCGAPVKDPYRFE